MGQDYVARKAAKKERKRTASKDGSSKPRRERKKPNQPRRNCRGMCFQQPALSDADKVWNGKEDDDEHDAAAAAFETEALEEQQDKLLEQQQHKATEQQQASKAAAAKPAAKEKPAAGSKKRKQAAGGDTVKLSTGIQLLSPAAAAASVPAAKASGHAPVDVPEALQPFHPLIQKAMLQEGHAEPTPVQALCWPTACTGRDVQAVAEPGSGKTLAYLLPAAARLADAGHDATTQPEGPLLLVLAPTRELALQIGAQSRALRRATGLRTTVVYGGADREQQVEALQRKPHVLVATPGRLLDLCDAGALSLSHVSHVVLDEADKMLSLGFEPQLERLHGLLFTTAPAAAAPPAKRRKAAAAAAAAVGGDGSGGRPQVLLFTATMPESVAEAAARWLQADAEIVQVALSADAISRTVTQVVHVCAEHKKPAKLLKHLGSIKEQSTGMRNPPRVIIFANKIKTVRFIADTLVKEEYRAVELHGKRSQTEREEAIGAFRSGKAQVLVATDVAARGLDVRGLPYVVNYDFPSSLVSYIHRVGRTGRLAAKGHAYSFFTRNLARLAPDLVELLQHHGQSVDPNLLQLAESWQLVEEQLAAAGGGGATAKQSTLAGVEDGEEDEEGEAAMPTSAAVAEDLQEGLAGSTLAAGALKPGKKLKKRKGQEVALDQPQEQAQGAEGLARPLHSNDYEKAFLQLVTEEQAAQASRKASKGKSSDGTAGPADEQGAAAGASGSKRLRLSGVVTAFQGAFASLVSPADSDASDGDQEQLDSGGIEAPADGTAGDGVQRSSSGSTKRRKQPPSQGAELLVPRPAAAAGAEGAAAVTGQAATPFLPSKRFAGAKKGYAFKLGSRGLGYYLDTPPMVAGKAAKQRQQAIGSVAATAGGKPPKRHSQKQQQQQQQQQAQTRKPVQQAAGKQPNADGELRLIMEADDVDGSSDDETAAAAGREKRRSLPGRLRKKLAKLRGKDGTDGGVAKQQIASGSRHGSAKGKGGKR